MLRLLQPFLLAGLLAGLRLSYLPFVAVPLVGLLAVQSRLRVPLVAAGLAGTVVWLVPLVVDTGWAALVAAAQQQTVGHFTDFGGTALAEPAGWGTRLGRTIEAVWADGLGGWWPGRHGLTVLVALGHAAAFVAGEQALREDEAERRALWWLLGCAAVYAVWIVAYQNVLYKSRHALPLIAVALFVLALGLTPLLVRGAARGPGAALGAGALALGVAALYAAWHGVFTGLVPAPTTSLEALAPRLGLALIAVFALFGLQVTLLAAPGGRLARALRPRLYAGLQLDEGFTHLTLRIWPAPRPAPAARGTTTTAEDR